MAKQAESAGLGQNPTVKTTNKHHTRQAYSQLLGLLPSKPQKSNIDVEAKLAHLYLKVSPGRLGRRLGLSNIKLANGQKRTLRKEPTVKAVIVSPLH